MTTYSFWNSYRNCPRACAWRYLDELAPLERSVNLRFGALIHRCLETWHQRHDLVETLDVIEQACAGRRHDPEVNAAWHLATAMMLGYALHYPEDPFMFHREVLYFSRDQLAEVERELWQLSQQFLWARRHGGLFRNTGYCFHFGRPCAYYPLCRANGAAHVIANLYERRPPHEELLMTPDDAPVF